MRKSTLIMSLLVATLVSTGALVSHAEQSGLDKMKEMTKQAADKAGDYLDDSSITAEVKAKIFDEKSLDSLDISVKTSSGVVMLTGVVDNLAQSRLAEMLAQNTKSVKAVDNRLAIKQ